MPRKAMSAVNAQLVSRSDGLVKLFTPPFDHSSHDPGYIKAYPPGLRENGGQYTHAAIWSTLAFAMMGDGDRAGELLSLLNPLNHASTGAGIHRYKVEPYVVCADGSGEAARRPWRDGPGIPDRQAGCTGPQWRGYSESIYMAILLRLIRAFRVNGPDLNSPISTVRPDIRFPWPIPAACPAGSLAPRSMIKKYPQRIARSASSTTAKSTTPRHTGLMQRGSCRGRALGLEPLPTSNCALCPECPARIRYMISSVTAAMRSNFA